MAGPAQCAQQRQLDIYYIGSRDGGTTWLPTDVRLDTGTSAGTTDSGAPQIAASGPAVAVIWSEDLGTYRIRSNQSYDDGQTWLSAEVRVDTGSGDALWPRIAATGAAFHAAYHEGGTSGNHDVFYNLASGAQPYGAGTAGSGSALPSLGNGGNAMPGGTLILNVANCLGAAPALLVGSFGPATTNPQPLLGGTLWVQPTQTLSFTLYGATGQPGAGLASIPMPVPQSLGLLGLNANFQVLVLDPGAIQGVAMTNGLAVWIG